MNIMEGKPRMYGRVWSSLRGGAVAALTVVAALGLSAAVASGKPVSSPSHAAAAAAAVQVASPATCTIHSLPTFTAQGEFGTTATVADVVEVECDPLLYGTGSQISVSAAQLYDRCGQALTWYVANPYSEVVDTRSVTLTLDADGNATVGLIAGPGCVAGESLISAHMDGPPFESFTTSFTVLPPGETPEGVQALPATQVEDAQVGGIETIIEAEFPGSAEQPVRIGSDELLGRCQIAPHVHWVREDRTSAEGVSEVNGLSLDNDGNAFVLLIGDSSCYPGSSVIEADLESNPFTTLTTEFTIEPPQPTAEPALAIEKLQQIAGGGHGFTSSPITGTVGQTVEYKIVVSNTSSVSETLSDFTDPRCDEGTIAGGPGSSPVTPGESTTYTCRHVLTAVGPYINQAGVTANTAGGKALEQMSNEVEVQASPPPHPELLVEKAQMIDGSGAGFVTTPLTSTVGETVDYQIVVTNKGNVVLSTLQFEDAHCDPGTIAGGPGGASLAPGQQTTYTCKHVLAGVGRYINEASVTATPVGETPVTGKSQPVEVTASAAPEMGMKVAKLQRLAGGASFTASPLAAVVGQTVEYEIIVSNTGNVALALSNFSDPHCDPGTIAGGPGATPVAVGDSATFTCRHVVATVGSYFNVAEVAGSAPGKEKMTLPSPTVEVDAQNQGGPPPLTRPKIGKLGRCEAASALRGISGPKRRPFTVRVSASGVKQITIYLDGRHLRTMHYWQAKSGVFSVKIKPEKLHYGAHRISIKTVMRNPICATTASARTFVRPFAARVAPRFTG